VKRGQYVNHDTKKSQILNKRGASQEAGANTQAKQRRMSSMRDRRVSFAPDDAMETIHLFTVGGVHDGYLLDGAAAGGSRTARAEGAQLEPFESSASVCGRKQRTPPAAQFGLLRRRLQYRWWTRP
jgi:hypothetical protein